MIIKRLFKLAWPFFIAQLFTAGMMLTDTWMAAQAGTNDLAAVAVGSNLMLLAIMFLYGFLMVLSPKIAYYRISNPIKIASYLYASKWLAMLLSLVVVFIMMGLIWLLPHLLAQTPEIVSEAQYYLLWSLPGIFFAAYYMTYRFAWEGLNQAYWTLVVSGSAFLINIPLNWLLVLGIGSWEGLGGEGCGFASSLAFFFSALMAHFLAKRHDFLKLSSKLRLKHAICLWPELNRLGLPAAFALLSEVALFMLLALLIAKFGVTQLAAHQITLNLTSMIYVLPLSFSMALAIEIGRAHGEKNEKVLKQMVRTGQVGAVLIGGALCLMLILLHTTLPRFFSDTHEVIWLATSLLLYAAAYQVADALQMTYAGILRGLGETLIVFKTTLLAYWGVGLLGGYVLANTLAMRAEGYWLGLVLALVLNSLLLGYYAYLYLRRLNHPSDEMRGITHK